MSKLSCRSGVRLTLFLTGSLLLLGCRASTDNSTIRSAKVSPREAVSSRKSFHVSYTSSSDPIPLNQPFGLDVVIRRGDDRSTPVDDATLTVDARMPAHNHGMNVEPKINKSGNGQFRVEGMLFHMAGPWEIYLDVSRNGITERTAFGVAVQ